MTRVNLPCMSTYLESSLDDLVIRKCQILDKQGLGQAQYHRNSLHQRLPRMADSPMNIENVLISQREYEVMGVQRLF